MKKNGHDRLGSQRWMCTDCNATRGVRHYRRRDRGELGAFLAWLLGPAAQPGPSCTFRRRTAGCWRIHPRLETDGVVRHVLMADGTYLRHGRCLLTAIDGASGAVVAFRWCRHETTADYLALFEKIPAPDVLVCDGMRGIETAARSAWPSTRIQRCLVHVRRDCVNDLTHRPRLQAGRELKRLADALVTIREPDQAARWAVQLHDRQHRWHAMLHERTFAREHPDDPRAARQSWWWTHQPLRRCYRRLERLWRNGTLFAFLDPGLRDADGRPPQRTSNRLEGGVNAPIKRMLVNHRGLSDEHRMLACEWLCYMKSEHPDPYRFLDQLHEQHKEGHPDDDTPGMGHGIDWNEFPQPHPLPQHHRLES